MNFTYHKLAFLVFSALIMAVALSTPGRAADANAAVIPPVPTPGLVTMLDLGATQCVPCKMMAPIIEELKADYQGRASIIFIDVWQHREQAQRFGIKGIPTQIFYDQDGNEVARHVGFMDKKSIVSVFKKLGVPH
jgi:thioredoxin 1